MTTPMSDELRNILEDVDRATAPDKMSQKEALDWLEELRSELQTRCEALRDEIDDS